MHSFQRGSIISNIISRIPYYFVVFLLIPGIFVFQLTIVYPFLIVAFDCGIGKRLIHICIIAFWFINVVGNMIFSMMRDSTLKMPVFGEGTYCEYCRMSRPAKSWHCKICNACIIKRDHHCTFLARCIGLYNQRYFILFLGYVTLAMLYTTYYNYYYITLRFDDDVWVLSAARIINPMLRFVIPEPLSLVDFYVLYLFMNVGVIFWSFCLFFYHLRNVVTGVTSYESKFPSLMDSSKWKQNLLKVFGTRWYWAIICPLCSSPLPLDDKIP